MEMRNQLLQLTHHKLFIWTFLKKTILYVHNNVIVQLNYTHKKERSGGNIFH